MVTEPHPPVPHLPISTHTTLSTTSWTTPGIVTPPPLWADCSVLHHAFWEEIFPNTKPEHPLTQPKAIISHALKKRLSFGSSVSYLCRFWLERMTDLSKMIPRRAQPGELMVRMSLVWNTRCFFWAQSETLTWGSVLWKEHEKILWRSNSQKDFQSINPYELYTYQDMKHPPNNLLHGLK